MNTIFSIIFVYIFIVLGYIAKAIFKDRIDSKTLTIYSVYFMQPFVTIWGFSTDKLTLSAINVIFIYLFIILILLIPAIFIGKIIFKDAKKRAIFTIAGFVGNTGNLGIPLGIALFGESSVLYTTLINLANVLVVYIIGVYIYSRGSFSIKESLLNIIKIPIIPAAIVAGLLNVYGINFPSQIKEMFKMGAYSGIVLQLFLLGTFLEGIKIKVLDKKLLLSTLSQKFIFVPLMSFVILQFLNISPLVKDIILMEMLTPLAIANINLSALYDCRPKDVTALILISTTVFIGVIIIFVQLLGVK